MVYNDPYTKELQIMITDILTYSLLTIVIAPMMVFAMSCVANVIQ